MLPQNWKNQHFNMSQKINSYIGGTKNIFADYNTCVYNVHCLLYVTTNFPNSALFPPPLRSFFPHPKIRISSGEWGC